MDPARKPIAGLATDAPSARSQINSQRQEIGVQALAFQTGFEVLNVRLVGHRRKRERGGARRIRGVSSVFAVDGGRMFRTTIVRFVFLVADWPRRGNSFLVFKV